MAQVRPEMEETQSTTRQRLLRLWTLRKVRPRRRGHARSHILQVERTVSCIRPD